MLICDLGRFELFLDLLYVAILSNFADSLTEDISGAKLAKYIVSVSMATSQHCLSYKSFIRPSRAPNLIASPL